MLVVDSQVHTAAPGKGTWNTDQAERREGIATGRHYFPETDEMLREMDGAGVDAAVLVPPLSPNAEPDNTPWVEAVREHPTRFGLMARFLAQDSHRRGELEELLQLPELLGIRLSFHGNRGNVSLLQDGSLEWFWTAAEEADFPVMVNAPAMTEQLLQISRRHLKLRLIVDHLAIPFDSPYDDLRPVVRPLLELASQALVAVKATALPAVTREEYPFPNMRECLRDVIGAFGSKRVFWGSDISRLPCPYENLAKFFIEELDFLSEDEVRDVMGVGIVKFLRWDAPQLGQGSQPMAYSLFRMTVIWNWQNNGR